MMLPNLVIAPSPKGGRGVFTTKNIAANTVLEISPVIVLTVQERKDIEKTKLFHYIFEWGKTRKLGCMALGYVSMYNHDYASNCEYEMDFEARLMTIKTVKAVKKGEELCINYNADPNDKTLVWFHK
ncbi:SET domain-containing protein [Foetidibacter luteolus]|uniref:SET domain-containing protein n=1 Tax=Foetidibacter luteolus TaxID=2608880 RepID=UPI00129BD575|nr:SET domain-containing protein [Foetidibacter luteolus]